MLEVRVRAAALLSRGLVVFLLSIGCTATAYTQVTNSADNSGVQPFQSYLHDKEVINPATGGLNMNIPLLHLRGRAGHDLDFAINYNNQSILGLGIGAGPIIDPGTGLPVPDLTQYYVGFGPTPGTGGWSNTMPAEQLQAFDTVWTNGVAQFYSGAPTLWGDHGEQITFGLAQKGRYPLSSVPQSFAASAAADDQGQDIVANLSQTGPDIFYFPDGRRLVSTGTAMYDVDRNGNTITYTSGAITDTLGRTVSLSPSVPGGSLSNNWMGLRSLQYVNSNSQTETIQFIYGGSPAAQAVTLDEPTPGNGWGWNPCTYLSAGGCVQYVGTNGGGSNSINLSQSPLALSAIILPNGQTYTFQYDGYGDLIKVTYPAGGYTRYTYQKTLHGVPVQLGGLDYEASVDVMQVAAKYVCTAAVTPPGTTVTPIGNTCSIPEEATTYTPASSSGFLVGNDSNTVKYADGTTTQYSFMNHRSTITQSNHGGLLYSGFAQPSCGPILAIFFLSLQWLRGSETLAATTPALCGITLTVADKFSAMAGQLNG